MKFNLSEISEVIRERRTIQPEAFSKRKVHREIIENILTNGTWAPTHGKTQPWRFKVFTDAGLERLGIFQAETYKKLTLPENFKESTYRKLGERPLLSSVVIAICMERTIDSKIPELEEVEAVACAVQNIQLTCTAYGLGSFWSSGGVTYFEETKQWLGLKPEDKVLGFLYIGYTDLPWPKSHRKPLEYVTEWLDK